MDKIAEIIESTTTGFTAESYELYDLPPFGSLVKTADPPVEIYAVVCQAGTSSIEPGRHPIARGRDAESEAEIYDANPQLSRLLRSEFQTLVVGYGEDEVVRQYLPARPARIHAFVYPCSLEEAETVRAVLRLSEPAAYARNPRAPRRTCRRGPARIEPSAGRPARLPGHCW